ncbi:hypothetical protein A9G43_05700 [Gilliamella sp. Occ3-1]|uniref:hypothetical protein n=1 Tax=Gilliamella sp. Occ3-1 TaxID=3120253 RepID=UPI00080DC86B|nr:hypothetical protein [Gilliamella apicola]OCG71274.1 hypothetical protein A9G43_05700 [Gilliamella apicola]
MEEMECNISGINIKYKFKPKKYDNNHLIIVFSGFGAASEFTYDFENLLQISNANVLWIKDDFYGHCCYYLCKEMNFDIEKAIITFIYEKIEHLKLSKKNCSLIGFSKGGSAALYYGIKYGFENILTTVPQTYIGSYIEKYWPDVAKHMMGKTFNDNEIATLNSKIINLLKNDNKKQKNIYLITSKQDIQYNTEIVPLIDELFKYSNMNFIISESIFVRAHNQVTSHHSQFILGILYILTNNIAPHLGYKILEGERRKEIEDKSGNPVIDIKYINLNNNLLFIEGVALLRGIEFKEYEDVDYFLKFTNIDSQEIIKLKLAKMHKANITKEYYNGDFVIYDKAWVTTHKNQGVSLEKLEKGLYELHLLIYANHENFFKTIQLNSNKVVNLQSKFKGVNYAIKQIENHLILKISNDQ